jgi:DNA-binding MarR family transcriptional regulator
MRHSYWGVGAPFMGEGQFVMSDVRQWPTARLLSTAAHELQCRWDTHLSNWDLNASSLRVLDQLVQGESSQRELAAVSRVTEQTMCRVLDRLVRLGYVTRERDLEDRRRSRIAITPAGATARDAAWKEAYAQDQTLEASSMTDDDLKDLRSLLVKLVEAEPN